MLSYLRKYNAAKAHLTTAAQYVYLLSWNVFKEKMEIKDFRRIIEAYSYTSSTLDDVIAEPINSSFLFVYVI